MRVSKFDRRICRFLLDGTHASGPSRPINYDPDHYEQALEGKRGLADADIAEAARANLALLDSLGGA